MTMRPSVREAMLAAVPSLRAFAISLSGNVDRADDLVQETLLRAMANINSFQPGTNMSAWLFTILRNLFRSEYRKRRREVEDTDGSYAESLKSHPEQHSRVEFEEFRAALAKLPPDQREALILVGAPVFPTKKQLPSANVPLERSRAASTGRARGWRNCCPSTGPTISAPTVPHGRSSPPADAGDEDKPSRASASSGSPLCPKNDPAWWW